MGLVESDVDCERSPEQEECSLAGCSQILYLQLIMIEISIPLQDSPASQGATGRLLEVFRHTYFVCLRTNKESFDKLPLRL